MCETCHSTDFTLTPSSTAISRLRLPSTTSCGDAALGGAQLGQPTGELAVGCLAEPLEQPADAAEQRARAPPGGRTSPRSGAGRWPGRTRSAAAAAASPRGRYGSVPRAGRRRCRRARRAPRRGAPTRSLGRSDRRQRAQRVGDGVRRVQDPRLGELLLDEPDGGGDLAAAARIRGQPAAPGQPGVVVRRRRAPRRRSRSRTPPGRPGPRAAANSPRPKQARAATGPRTRTREVSSREKGAAPRRSPRASCDSSPVRASSTRASSARSWSWRAPSTSVQGVGDAALQQRVAGFATNTGGNVRCRFDMTCLSPPPGARAWVQGRGRSVPLGRGTRPI